MKVDEADPTLRRIGPVQALDANGDPVLGEDFAGAGESEIMVAGAAFVATTGTWVEIGAGYYYYQCPLVEAATRPWVALKLAIVCQEVTFREDVTPNRQAAIDAGETDAALLVIGPLLALDASDNPITTLVGVTSQLTINGAAWDTPDGDLTFGDDGYLYYVADPTEAALSGWLAIKLGGTAQEMTFREDIGNEAGSSGDTEPPEIEIISPTPGVAPGEPGGFPRRRSDAITTPIVLRVGDAAPGLAYLEIAVRFYGSADELAADQNPVEETVYRRGNFRGLHVQGSFVEVDGNDLILTVYRVGGWIGRYIKFAVDPLDADGNLTE